jgi:hypothetical protein
MNYYVARLLAVSRNPAFALGLGWHVWSVARGVCYALLLYEVSSHALALTSRRFTVDRRARVWRWSLAAACFALDCSLKSLLMEPVRLAIRDNLR